MRSIWNPDTLFPLAQQAALYARSRAKDLREELRKKHASKPVRCGFLWLNKRAPNEAEVRTRLRESGSFMSGSFDHVWWDIQRWEDTEAKMIAISLQCKAGCDTLELSEKEARIIANYGRA